MTTKEEKLNIIKSFKKESEIHTLLEELLPTMGFDDVTLTHERGNAPENGKDLICSVFDVIENKKDWYAFVVKKGVIAGTSAAIKDVDGQVTDCFVYEYKSITKGERIKINKVKVVTNNHFSAGATSKILERNSIDKANIDFWDGDKLLAFIENFYPQYWLKGSKSYKTYIERFESRIGNDDLVKSLNMQDNKLSKMIEFAIKQRLTEKIKNEDGTFMKKSRSCNSIIDLDQNSIVIGEPGSGKSSLFKKLAKDIILQNGLRNNSDFYPVLINFRDLSEHDFDLKKTISEYFKQDWNNDLLIDGNQLIKNGSLSVFVDALDELAKVDLKQKALNSITDFQREYKDIKIVCSSRPSDFIAENEETLGFKILEIEDLNPAQIKEFISSFFGENIIKSKRLLKSLQDTGLLDKLPKTPLTIALITIIFDEKEIEIPATLADLYRHFVELLLGKASIAQTTDVIEIGIKQRLLSYIAKHLHTNNIYSIVKDDIIEVISSYSIERGQVFDANLMLMDLINHSGLLFENEKSEIQFKHLSFQEYFTAYEYFHHRQSESNILVTNFNILWWQNVTLFYAGMSKDAPELLQRILKEAEPKSFFEVINNIGGLGRISQALYNTSKKDREAAISKAIESSIYSIYELINSEEPKLQFWKKFSKYGIYQIISGWFQHNFSSITLLEPLKAYFNQTIEKTNSKSGELSQNDLFELEISLFMASSILASPLFAQFGEFKNLVEIRKSEDLSLIALIEMHFRLVYKTLSREDQLNPDVSKVHKKLKDLLRNLGTISEKVNVTLIDEAKATKKLT